MEDVLAHHMLADSHFVRLSSVLETAVLLHHVDEEVIDALRVEPRDIELAKEVMNSTRIEARVAQLDHVAHDAD